MSINCFSLFLVVGVANSFFLVSQRKYNSFGSSINLATFVFPFFIVQTYRLYLSKNEHLNQSINSTISFRYKISVGTGFDWERKSASKKETWKVEEWYQWNRDLKWSDLNGLDNWTKKCWEMEGEIFGLESQSQVVFLTKIVRSRLSFFAFDLTLSGVLIWNVSKTMKAAYFLTWRRNIQLGPPLSKMKISIKFRIRYILFLIVKI